MVTTMGQEEKSQRQSKKTSSGGRSPKKLKPKKIPQRGLGVAQLERIRREEQEKKDAAAQQAASFFCTNASCFSAVECRPQLSHHFSCVLSPADHILSSSSSFRISPPFTSADTRTNSVSISTSNNVGGCKLNHQGPAFHANGNMPYGSNNTPIGHLPCVMRRSEQCQQPCCSSSMVNVPSGVSSSSSSSVKNFQTERPLSNQSYCYTTPVWPDEEKMVGIETLYPFRIDNAPVPSFNSRFPPEYASFIPRTDETASCNKAGTFNLKPTANPVLRQGSSSSNSMSEQRMRLFVEENEGFNADFLTLAPPRPKHPSPHIITNRLHFDSPPYQGTTVGVVKWRGPGLPIQQPFFSFLPSATQNDQSISTKSNCNGLVESVDLNLKL